MNIFKLKINDSTFYSLTRDIFNDKTQRKSPWNQIGSDGKNRYYAVCPACENTIQLIGFHLKNTTLNENSIADISEPFGKHFLSREINHLGLLSKSAYEQCPYASKNQRHPKPNEKYNVKSRIPNKLLHLLRDEFDRIMWCLEKSICIQLPSKYRQTMLNNYLHNEGWWYAGSTLLNLPWTFAYNTNAIPLIFCKIQDEDMKKALQQRYPSAVFNQYNKLETQGKYIAPTFCFLSHKRHLNTKNHHLTETMVLSISDESGKPIYQKTIEFKPFLFNKIIQSSNQSNRDIVLLQKVNKAINDIL
ncbi:hypothetical protein [Photobacterium leiognathi]|uniref:hypothetical protein n=1 Tax=Photobacterium leiognathi TaxID=553611 RepID=UPI002981A323|nr:hypothetical protein [Photobacterium leiognathi]